MFRLWICQKICNPRFLGVEFPSSITNHMPWNFGLSDGPYHCSWLGNGQRSRKSFFFIYKISLQLLTFWVNGLQIIHQRQRLNSEMFQNIQIWTDPILDEVYFSIFHLSHAPRVVSHIFIFGVNPSLIFSFDFHYAPLGSQMEGDISISEKGVILYDRHHSS